MTAKMQSVRLYAAGDIRVDEIDPPDISAPDDVLLKVTAAGICGSDLHNFRTGQWISRSPSVAGHEFAGVVIAMGSAVRNFVVGDTVVADSRYWCGACVNCQSGRKQVCEKLGFVGEVCDGGFAEFTCLPERLLVKHEPSLDPAIAAMAEPLAVALHAVRKLNAPAGEPVVVVGCGPIGGLAAVLLSRLHDGPILLSDRNSARVERVAAVTGARSVSIDAHSLAGFRPAKPVRYAIDATGNISVLSSLVDALSPGGAVALVGIGHGKIEMDPNVLVEKEMSLIGCHAFVDELPEAVSLLPSLATALKTLIETEIPLSDVPTEYQRLLQGKSEGLKTIIRP